MPVKSRLIEFIKFKKISIRRFCKVVGVSSGYVTSMRNSIQPHKLSQIAAKFPDLNTGWLLTGEGSMLKDDITMPPISRSLFTSSASEVFKDKLIELFKSGEIYSASVVQEQNALIQSLYCKISKLEEENEILKAKIAKQI